jgi:hypothetical protein
MRRIRWSPVAAALISLIVVGSLEGCAEKYSGTLEGDTQTPNLTPGKSIPLPQTDFSKASGKK